MPTTSIPIGPPFEMLQNVEYALPAVSCFVLSVTAAIQTSLTLGGTYTTTNSPILTGAFVRCATGNATITLRKNGVE
jgi:hypothetical protein